MGKRKSKREEREVEEPVSPPEAETDEEFELPEVVHVGRYTVRLGVPRSFATRYELIGAVHEQGLRGLAACLGLSWAAGGSKAPPKATYARAKYDALTYGGQVFDELVARGVPAAEISEAGKVAFMRLTQDLPGAREVDEAEDFSEGTED